MVAINKETGRIVASHYWNGYWNMLRTALMPGHMTVEGDDFFGLTGERSRLIVNEEWNEFVVEFRGEEGVIFAETFQSYWEAYQTALVWSNLYNKEAAKFFEDSLGFREPEMRRAYEFSDEYDFGTEVEPLLEYCNKDKVKRIFGGLSEVTAYFALYGDADYKEIWFSDSNRPYDRDSDFTRVL